MPPNLRDVELSACVNGWKSFSMASADRPIPGVLDREADDQRPRPARRRGAQRDAAALGELDGVADEVEQDLPDPRRVTDRLPRQVVVDLDAKVELLRRARSGREARPTGTITCLMSNAVFSISIRPASSFERSRMSLMMTSRLLDDVRTIEASWRPSSVIGASTSSAAAPTMPLSGVRISWLMTAKLGLARAPSRAASRAASSSVSAARRSSMHVSEPAMRTGFPLASQIACPRERNQL